MKASINVFIYCGLFFMVVAVVYGFVTNFNELVGFPALLLVGVMSIMIGTYLWLTDRRVGRQPQDNDVAEISDADADYGFFSVELVADRLRRCRCGLVLRHRHGMVDLPVRRGARYRRLIGISYEHDRGGFAH